MVNIELKEWEINQEALNLFREKHKHESLNCGTIQGYLSYQITPTGIGDAVSIFCSICNQSADITNYDVW